MSNSLPSAFLIGIGISIAGWQIGSGFVEGRQTERSVTVKGLAQREVLADTAIWPIRFVANGDELESVRDKIAVDEAAVRKFMGEFGLAADAIQSLGLNVKDMQADPYRNGPIESRFIVTRSLVIRSQSVEDVASAAASLAQLLSEGVVISSEFGNQGNQPIYQFTGLNDLKPDMLREATANARSAAEQFAQDSQSEVGDIVDANQGVFQVFARDQVKGVDPNTQVHKIVRVVSTLEYELVD